MAIVIPSKNIYSKSFDPVIDNNIDRVEVGTKNAVPDNHYSETVYNEDVYSGFVSNSQDIQDKQSQLFNPVVNINNPVVYAYAAAIYADGQYYLSKNIKIPIQPDNKHLITSLLLGISKEGEKNIRYSCKGKINKGTTNASILLVASINGVAVQSWSTTLIPPIDNGYFKSEETTGNFTIADKDSVTITNGDGSISLTAEIDIPTIDNLATVEASEVTIDGKKYFSLDLQNILCGIRITKGGGRITAMPMSAQNKTALSGSISGLPFVEYIPEIVTLTVYGNTIGIDLKDKTVSIGNGNKVFSFDGNELIQSTNTPTQESKYQGVINEWRNGKQTAVITCPIADFYDENGDKVIDTSVSEKMLFDIGDIVIPYTYTNQGDKPIAYNKDFTPKQFKVVGTKISKNQGGTQELTLQEV